MPLPNLPFDLIAAIVSHLEEEEDDKVPVQIKEGRAISLVCKTWMPLGQALRWRTVKPGPQRISSLVDHFAHYVHLNNLVRKLGVNTIREHVLDDVFAQLPGFLSRLVNLRSLIIYGAFGRSLTQVPRACSRLGNLDSFEVIAAGVEWSNDLVLSLHEGFTKLSNLSLTLVEGKLGDRSQKVTTRHSLIPLQTLFLRLGFQPVGLRSFADDFLSMLDPMTLRHASLVDSAAIDNTVGWLAACPNLAQLDISVLTDEVSLQFHRALLLLPRYSSLESFIFLVRIPEVETTISPIPLVNVLASFSPSLRWFVAQEIVFPDYKALPFRPAADLDDDDITSLEVLYPRDGEEGETGSLLVWGQKEEGRIEWYRDVDGDGGLDADLSLIVVDAIGLAADLVLERGSRLIDSRARAILMSSLISTTDKSLGQCVVCGKETSIGCSTCSRAGIDWMYFCSVDHQRLIWKVHKRVCGKNPFEWPHLDEAEVKEAWALRNEPYLMDSSDSWRNNRVRDMDRYIPGVSVTPDQLFAGTLHQLAQSELVSKYQGMLRDHRLLSVSVKIRASQAGNKAMSQLRLLELFSNDPLGFVAWIERRYEDDFPADTTLSSNFQHRILILFTLLSVTTKEYLEDGRKFTWKENAHVEHSKSLILRCHTDELSQSDPEGAREVVAKMMGLHHEFSRTSLG